MVKNIGQIDRGLRVVVGLLLVLLIVKGSITGAVAIIAGVFAAVFIITSSLGTCPLYILLRISTNKNHEEE
jgi:hypothetical protein